jgi:hypothetical protein
VELLWLLPPWELPVCDGPSLVEVAVDPVLVDDAPPAPAEAPKRLSFEQAASASVEVNRTRAR